MTVNLAYTHKDRICPNTTAFVETEDREVKIQVTRHDEIVATIRTDWAHLEETMRMLKSSIATVDEKIRKLRETGFLK